MLITSCHPFLVYKIHLQQGSLAVHFDCCCLLCTHLELMLAKRTMQNVIPEVAHQCHAYAYEIQAMGGAYGKLLDTSWTHYPAPVRE